jgi:hypothetical protein
MQVIFVVLLGSTADAVCSSTAEAQAVDASAVLADSEAREQALIDRLTIAQREGRLSRRERARLARLFRRLDLLQSQLRREGFPTTTLGARRRRSFERANVALEEYVARAVAG